MRTLDYILEQQNLSVQQVAEMANLQPERVEAITVGRWTASPKERSRISEALNLNIDDIIWGHYMEPRVQQYRRIGFERDFQ
ncbi:MAG: helix-turn-helix transcriptional regulator [Planctomycetota bacterium]|nr:helix-turn-helix transcriptional regulator [Planctomycetota bacterium]